MIEFKNVAMHFGERMLFENVALALPQGSFHFLTGPSGAGKTTLIRLCSVEMRASAGEVRLFEEPVSGMNRNAVAHLRSRIGIVHQDSRFIDHLSLAENILMPLAVSRTVTSQDRDHLEELLAWVGLSGQGGQTPPELSGGERQRAALARAVILSPDILLADEPTGNVDWEMSLRLLDLLIELNRMGKTVLCATHDMNLIRQAKSRVSARVLRLRGGAVELAGAEL